MNNESNVEVMTNITQFSKSQGFRVTIGALLLVLALLLVYAVQVRRESAHIAAAPRLSVDMLTLAYQKHTAMAHKQYDHKFLVLTGYVTGKDEGLFGDGAIHMGGDYGEITCDMNYGDCMVGQSCTVAGTCNGIDSYGMIRFSECRVLSSLSLK
jgi:hypothetical protein